MSNSKIQIKIGPIEFSGEGEATWLSAQIDKIIEKAPELLKHEQTPTANASPVATTEEATENVLSKISKPKNLSTFLRDKNATSNQVKKFLTTAAFIQLNGKSRLVTGEVSKALKDANQTKIVNPSDKLNQNVTKGFCEKDGKEFFVTSHGFEELGITIE